MEKNLKKLVFPNKAIRAKVIAEFVRRAGYRGVVAFSCGNATEALRGEGLYVVDISPRGDLEARRWWDLAEIRRAWPTLFDATSGHLPAPLMVEVARAFKEHLGHLSEQKYEVPTGSGETIVCLRWAYPEITFAPVYSLTDEATKFEPEAPLNGVVSGGV